VSGLEALALAGAAFVGSTAQSATGFGVVLPLAPLMFAFEDPPSAVLTITIAALAHNLLVLATRHRRLTIRAADAALLIGAALPGLILGGLIVSHVSKPAMQLAVGAAVIAAVAARAHQPDRAAAINNRPAGAGIGLLAGTLTTTVGLNGPPLVIWLRARRAPFEQIRDTLAVVFLTLNLCAIPTLRTHDATTSTTTLAALAAGLALGHAVGLTAGKRLHVRTLDRATIALLLAAAGASIAAGARAAL
jgi:uncharacterized membrane protein YfcA